MSWRDTAVRAGHRVGWRVAAELPPALTRGTIRVASAATVAADGTHLRTLRHNLTVATGREPSRAELRAAIASYLRTLVEVWTLPRATDRLVAQVRTVGEHVLRDAYASTGAVVSLPHSANWDLAGAWACRTGMPVTTVAERLAEADFRDFVALREGLGMAVVAHDEPGAIASLVQAARDRRLVCLLGDRDLGRTGVPVEWRGQPVTMPGGPAAVARRSGAALIPAFCHYRDDTMVIVFGDVVEARPGRAGLVAMTQQVADFFADHVARHPQDWHLLQPFFAEGLPA